MQWHHFFSFGSYVIPGHSYKERSTICWFIPASQTGETSPLLQVTPLHHKTTFYTDAIFAEVSVSASASIALLEIATNNSLINFLKCQLWLVGPLVLGHALLSRESYPTSKLCKVVFWKYFVVSFSGKFPVWRLTPQSAKWWIIGFLFHVWQGVNISMRLWNLCICRKRKWQRVASRGESQSLQLSRFFF